MPLPSAEQLRCALESKLSKIWPALRLIAQLAEQEEWSLYIVGGAVRDLLLGFIPSFVGGPQALTDIDLVVEGAAAGAGVALARALQRKYPQVSLQTHGQFQTAALVWPLPEQVATARSPLEIDVATARTESYPYPAANPNVKASSIDRDLFRRDFSINAMAICLTRSADGATVGTLIDLFNGWKDLQHHCIRVLHDESFTDDPTRIFRAVRFAVRLGFSIETHTEQLFRRAATSGVYASALASKDKTPALQSRLKTELKYLLQAKGWESALAEVDRLDAWRCLDADLALTPLLYQQLRRMHRWLLKMSDRPSQSKIRAGHQPNAKRIDTALKLTQPRWLILLELMLLQLSTQDACQVARNLNLGAASLRRLEKIPQWEAQLQSQLASAKRPSQTYALLKDYDLCELLLMSDRHPYTLGPQIWQYVVRLSKVASPIDGATLKRLGLRPGPQFREILTDVRDRALDGELTTPQAAKSYVLKHYSSTDCSSTDCSSTDGAPAD